MSSKKEKQTETFFQRLVKLNAVEVIGVAQMLGVEVIEGEKLEGDSRDFGAVMVEMIDKFSELDRRRRRNLLKIMEKAGKK